MKRTVSLLFLLIFSVTGISQNLDIRLLRSIYSPEPLGSDGFFRFTSNSEAYVAVGLPVGMAVAGLIRDDRVLLRNAACFSRLTQLSRHA